MSTTEIQAIPKADIPVKKLEHTRFGLPELGLGTWQMGGRYEPDFSNDEKEIAAIKAALDVGVTHIDTAEIYGAGHSEEIMGKAIKGVPRSKLLLTSKVHPNNFRRDRVLAACENSLKRLGTTYLDLYLLHWYEPGTPLKEAVRALDELVKRKLVKHIGVSNFTTKRLQEAQSYADHNLVCDQVYYNLQAREPETSGLLAYCQKNDVMLVAYRPVEKGKLLEGVPPLMEELCVKYQKTPAQIALNWLTSQKNVVTIFKTSNAAHLNENVGCLGWRLTEEDIELIRKNYPVSGDPELRLG